MKLVSSVQMAITRRKQPKDRVAPHYLSFGICIQDNLCMAAGKIINTNGLDYGSAQLNRSWQILKGEN